MTLIMHPHQSPQFIPRTTTSKPLFKNLAEQLVAVRNAALYSDTYRYVDERLFQLNERAQLHERAQPAGAGEQIPSIGGWVVDQEFSKELITRTFAQGELLKRFTQFPITKEWATGVKIPGWNETSRQDGSRFGGMVSAWANEADSAAVSKPQYRNLELNLHKLIGVVYASDELVQDAALLESSITLAFTNEFRFKLERSALYSPVGATGAAGPFGVLDVTNPALITVAKQSGQATATIVWQNIVGMWSRLWGASMPDAIWLVSESVFPQLLTLTIPAGTSGGSEIPLYKPAVAGERWGRMIGAPVVVTEYAASLGSLYDVVLIDPSQVAFCQKQDITSDISIHVDFLSSQSVYKFTYRCDSQPMLHQQLTPYNGSATLSPYIVLAPRP
jgi:HK97 family phage major capsid protein